MTGSAFRRNGAKHLGVATANDIKTTALRAHRTQVSAVRAFTESCEVAWVTNTCQAIVA